MSFLYRKNDAVVKICENREVLHRDMKLITNLDDWEGLEKENELRDHLCPYVVELSTQEEKADIYFLFIKEETVGLWYRTGGIIFHFAVKEDAMAFRLRF